MSIWPDAPSLFGAEGELVLLRISVEPRLLEDLLEVLAGLDFPVNPELHHRLSCVTVDFPAYSGKVNEVRKLLKLYNFGAECMVVERALVAHAS